METIDKQITVTGNNTIRDIQKVFNHFYPFLKIQFKKTACATCSLKTFTVNTGTKISEITPINTPLRLNMESLRTIAELEDDFVRFLGLTAEISRKSGEVWIQISITKSWTLESQNEAGKFVCNEMTLDE